MARSLICLPLGMLFCLTFRPGIPHEPASVPETVSRPQGTAQAIPEELGGDPVAFLELCLQRYESEVTTGYRTTMRKQETIKGKERPVEILDVCFREKPFSVYFQWVQGPTEALDPRRTLYVEGETRDNMWVVTGFPVAVLIGLDDDRVTSRSLQRITDFGFRKSTERVYRGWKLAQQEGTLHVEYLGVHPVLETGDRPCHVLRRTKYAKVPQDGVEDLTLYFDRDTLLQIGSVLRDRHGKLIGKYFFRNVELNPDFPPWQFTREALTRK
jgi:hypothetical protein